MVMDQNGLVCIDHRSCRSGRMNHLRPHLDQLAPTQGHLEQKEGIQLARINGDITTVADSSEPHAPDIAIEQPRAELLMRVEPQQT